MKVPKNTYSLILIQLILCQFQWNYDNLQLKGATIAHYMEKGCKSILDYAALNCVGVQSFQTIIMLEIENYDVKIGQLKKELNAVILAHNYQIPEIQDIADFVGDSLALSRAAAGTDADIIVFCGVHFMAETAAILCPKKTVLIPDAQAGCSLASAINPDELITWKSKHPEAVVISYVNTSAEIKALSDYCCTSANAVEITNSIPADKEILFLPDMFLGSYVARQTNRKNMHIWPGECHVHAGITFRDINKYLDSESDAELLIHPECGCTTSALYHYGEGDINKSSHVLSTEGMIKYASSSHSKKFIVATEIGILHRMKHQNPDKTFLPLKEDAICKYMKMITLEKVYYSLKKNVHVVNVPDKVRARARLAIERMLAV
ncbi:MAG TPA: quinolinate synthase NadA [Nitrososphaeraceae archaeon]|nr:quinolinate synthase NadA [Nitrososphaeraceae archaeon]